MLDYWIDGFNVFIFKNVSEEEYSVQRNYWERKNIEDSIPSKTTSVGDRSGLRASGVPDRKLDFANAPTLSSVVCRILEYCGRNINFMEHRAAANHLHIILWLRKIDTVDR